MTTPDYTALGHPSAAQALTELNRRGLRLPECDTHATTITVEGLTLSAALMQRYSLKLLVGFDMLGQRYVQLSIHGTDEWVTLYLWDEPYREAIIQAAVAVMLKKAQYNRLVCHLKMQRERLYSDIEFGSAVSPDDFEVGDLVLTPRSFVPAQVVSNTKKAIVIRYHHAQDDYTLTSCDRVETWYRVDGETIARLARLQRRLWMLGQLHPPIRTLSLRPPYINEGLGWQP